MQCVKIDQDTCVGCGAYNESEKRIKDMGSSAENMVLGFLNVYEDIYGEEKLNELLEVIKVEFDI